MPEPMRAVSDIESGARGAAPARSSAAHFLQQNLREHGLLLSLVAILAFFSVMTAGALSAVQGAGAGGSAGPFVRPLPEGVAEAGPGLKPGLFPSQRSAPDLAAVVHRRRDREGAHRVTGSRQPAAAWHERRADGAV